MTSVRVIPPYVLRLTFDDETTGEIDCRPWLFEREDGLFAELRDPAVSAKVWVDREADTVVWPNGADVAPETLYEEAHRSGVK